MGENAEVEDPEPVLPIVSVGDPVLRRPVASVDPAMVSAPEFQRLIDLMHATMDAAPGVGLAAPQVGVAVALAVMRDGPERWGALDEEVRTSRERDEVPFTVVVNPTIEVLPDEGTVAFFEGCLSVPGLAGVVERARAVRLRALDGNGEPFEQIYRGWPARIVQHEFDHLQGRLYLDTVVVRSLSTVENLARWAGHPLEDIGTALGFALPPG